MDAVANVHSLCEKDQAQELSALLRKIAGPGRCWLRVLAALQNWSK